MQYYIVRLGYLSVFNSSLLCARSISLENCITAAALAVLLAGENEIGGDAGIRAFYQNTYGATVARDRILTQIQYLYDSGCQDCGIVPFDYITNSFLFPSRPAVKNYTTAMLKSRICDEEYV